MLVTTHTAALQGLHARPVLVEAYVDKSSKEPQFIMVGLPDNTVRESRTRVTSAIHTSGYRLCGNRFYLNMAPADLRKEGSGYDLPVAVALLAASSLVDGAQLPVTMLVGELGFDGVLRPVRGILPLAIAARAAGYEQLILPRGNAREAAVVNRLKVYGADHLTEVVAHLNGQAQLEQVQVDTRAEFYAAQSSGELDFSDVKGQEVVKRACEVAAAGGHNLLLVGSPGCGKSMMAKRIPSILPQLTLAESLETTQVYSVAGKLGAEETLLARRPFRSPHHTVSDVALIGGGTTLMPGEISLAHNGVLFLDEFPEFSRSALETMRQPLEDRVVTISRAKYSATLPASFMLVAAMNPCPCGYYNHPTHRCSCMPGQIQRYMSKISGPLLDRIDIQVEVTPVPVEELSCAPAGESSAAIRERVVRARAVQTARFARAKEVHCNAQMTARQLETFARPDAEGTAYLARMMKHLDLSARSYERIRKVARTIADLDGAEHIGPRHLAEALSYRNLDRASWGE